MINRLDISSKIHLLIISLARKNVIINEKLIENKMCFFVLSHVFDELYLISESNEMKFKKVFAK
jgi:hypothetical protein